MELIGQIFANAQETGGITIANLSITLLADTFVIYSSTDNKESHLLCVFLRALQFLQL